jgi:hypothetical protein
MTERPYQAPYEHSMSGFDPATYQYLADQHYTYQAEAVRRHNRRSWIMGLVVGTILLGIAAGIGVGLASSRTAVDQARHNQDTVACLHNDLAACADLNAGH